MLSAIKNQISDSQVAHRIDVVSSAMPSINGLWVVVVVLVVFGWGVFNGWSSARSRDAWWRNQIAAASQSVREVVSKADEANAALETDIIAALGDTDAKLKNAERTLRSLAYARPAAGECRIPASSLRQGSSRR